MGPHHPQVAQRLNNLSAPYRANGDFTQARGYCERALEIREKSLGPDHPDVAESLTEMAALDFTQKRYDQARQSLQRSLRVREKALGSKHPEMTRSLMNYAALLRKTDETAEAKRLEVRPITSCLRSLLCAGATWPLTLRNSVRRTRRLYPFLTQRPSGWPCSSDFYRLGRCKVRAFESCGEELQIEELSGTPCPGSRLKLKEHADLKTPHGSSPKTRAAMRRTSEMRDRLRRGG